MREIIFIKLLGFLEQHPSRLLARLQLQVLMKATARAFGRKGKWILFSKDALKEYALFTKVCMETCMEAEKVWVSPKRLYRAACQLGRDVRRITGLKKPEDRQRLVFWLYRNIGITMQGSIPGDLLVTECFFSRIYDAGQCRFISAMDAGIMAGICGSGTLKFTERITQGCGECRACFCRKI